MSAEIPVPTPSTELVYIAKADGRSSVRANSMDSADSAFGPKPDISTFTQLERMQMKPERLHGDLVSALWEMKHDHSLGDDLQVICSHGTYMRTNEYLAHRTKPDHPYHDFTHDEIREDYNTSGGEKRDKYHGDNFGNVQLILDGLDMRIHDASSGEAFRMEMKEWANMEGTLEQKLEACPLLERYIIQSAIVMHTGWAFGNQRYDQTWVHTDPDRRLKSLTVAYNLVDTLVRFSGGIDPTKVKAEPLSRTDITALRQRNITELTRTNITTMWDRTMQVKMDLRAMTEDEKLFENRYMRALTSEDPEVGSPETRKTPQEARKFLKQVKTRFNRIANPQLAAAWGIQNEWRAGQLRNPNRRIARYEPGQEVGVRRKSKTEDGVTYDPRLAPLQALTESDVDNNLSAAAIMATYITDAMIPDKETVPNLQGFIDVVSNVLLHTERNGFLNGTNTNLEELSQVMHDVWAKIALWRDGETYCLQNRDGQLQCYRDLPEDEKQYDRIAVSQALKPMLAGMLHVADTMGFEIRVDADVATLVSDYRRRIVGFHKDAQPLSRRKKKVA